MFVLELGQAWVSRVADGKALPAEGGTLQGVASVQLIARLYHEFVRGDDCSPLAIEGLACEVLAVAAHSRQVETPRPRWLERVEDLLHETADGGGSRHIADEAGVHPIT
jgi:hypothetical protein